jgi:hypothetical protein
MAVALSKEGYFGFALQTEKGAYVVPTTWLPLIDAESVAAQLNYVLLNMADRNDYQSKYYGAGKWAAGRLPLPIVPGSVTDLLLWIQARDSDNQGKWASALTNCIQTVKKLTDAKVRRATFRLEKGEPVTCLLDIVALSIEAGAPASPVMPTAAPYILREASVQLTSGGGPLAADVNCERIEIVVDNVVEDPAEGMRLRDADEPLQLYNLSGIRCAGAFDRDFVDSAVYDDFLAGTEAALTVTLARGASTCSLMLPRLLYVGDSVGLCGAADQRLVERVNFLALGSTDGMTPPIILA